MEGSPFDIVNHHKSYLLVLPLHEKNGQDPISAMETCVCRVLCQHETNAREAKPVLSVLQ